MARGRKPKPTAEKRRTGNPGRRPLPEDEPCLSEPRKHCPVWLKGQGRREWRRLAPTLIEAGVVTVADLDTLARYCWFQGRFIEEARATEGQPLLATSEKTGQSYLTAEANLLGMLDSHAAKLAVELGLTPSARSRVKAAPKPPQDNPKNRFFKQALKVVG